VDDNTLYGNSAVNEKNKTLDIQTMLLTMSKRKLR
jgi:hypothetical protein